MHACMHACMHSCIHVRTCVRTCVRAYVCTYGTYECMYVWTRVCQCMHAQTLQRRTLDPKLRCVPRTSKISFASRDPQPEPLENLWGASCWVCSEGRLERFWGPGCQVYTGRCDLRHSGGQAVGYIAGGTT